MRNLTKLINFMGYFMDSSVLNNMGGGSLIYLPYPPPDKNNELHSRVHCWTITRQSFDFESITASVVKTRSRETTAYIQFQASIRQLEHSVAIDYSKRVEDWKNRKIGIFLKLIWSPRVEKKTSNITYLVLWNSHILKRLSHTVVIKLNDPFLPFNEVW